MQPTLIFIVYSHAFNTATCQKCPAAKEEKAYWVDRMVQPLMSTDEFILNLKPNVWGPDVRLQRRNRPNHELN